MGIQRTETFESTYLADSSGDPQSQDHEKYLVARTFTRLKEEYRIALSLDVQGYTDTEIAEYFGITVQAMRNLIHRARDAFKVQYRMLAS